jgi:hypothetical protein
MCEVTAPKLWAPTVHALIGPHWHGRPHKVETDPSQVADCPRSCNTGAYGYIAYARVLALSIDVRLDMLEKAKHYIESGLQSEPENHHWLKLRERLENPI